MNLNNIYIIRIKDLISNKWRQVSSYFILSRQLNSTQFEEKIIVPNPSTYVCTKLKYI